MHGRRLSTAVPDRAPTAISRPRQRLKTTSLTDRRRGWYARTMITKHPNQQVPETAGGRLRAARENASYTSRKKACADLGLNINTYKSHEYGLRQYGLAEAEQYAAAYHVTVPYLLRGDMAGTGHDSPVPYSVPHSDSSAHILSSEHDVPHKPLPSTIEYRNQELVTSGLQRRVQVSQRKLASGSKTGTRTTSTQTMAPLLGAAAFGVWVGRHSTPLFDSGTEVPAAPSHPPDLQYARKVIGDTRSGTFRDGDIVIFVRLPPGIRPPPGRLDVERRKAGLVENCIWTCDGRRLTTDVADLEEQETMDFDPDDTTVAIRGMALAVWRPIPGL